MPHARHAEDHARKTLACRRGDQIPRMRAKGQEVEDREERGAGKERAGKGSVERVERREEKAGQRGERGEGR